MSWARLTMTDHRLGLDMVSETATWRLFALQLCRIVNGSHSNIVSTWSMKALRVSPELVSWNNRLICTLMLRVAQVKKRPQTSTWALSELSCCSGVPVWDYTCSTQFSSESSASVAPLMTLPTITSHCFQNCVHTSEGSEFKIRLSLFRGKRHDGISS